MNYCTRCGKQLYEMENFCPNCGMQLSPPVKTSHIKSKRQKEPSHPILLVIAFIILYFILSVNLFLPDKTTSSKESISFISNDMGIKKTQEEIQDIKDVTQMRKALNNTVWTHTEVGDLLWIKLEFKFDKVMIYKALPSDGHWSFDEECTYILEEGRFLTDGKRYVAAVISSNDDDFSSVFNITNGHLTLFGFLDLGVFILGDYEWD